MTYTEGVGKKTHHEGDTDARKDDFDRWKYLEVNVGTQASHEATRRANALAKGGRECVEDIFTVSVSHWVSSSLLL
jgi:hypothetical protein